MPGFQFLRQECYASVRSQAAPTQQAAAPSQPGAEPAQVVVAPPAQATETAPAAPPQAAKPSDEGPRFKVERPTDPAPSPATP